MALTRLAAFATGTVLTSSQLTSEFDNIYNNALTLISPLTANLSFGGFNANNIALGSAAAPSINWTGNTNTGLFSPAANQVAIAVAGVGAANFTAAAAGPHVIGGTTTNSRYALLHTGTITLSGATQEAGIASDQALTNASGVNLYGVYYTQTLTNVAGATTTMAWLAINPATITITAGSVTNAATLYLNGAPAGATNNYATWSVSGINRFGGSLLLDATTTQLAFNATSGANSSAIDGPVVGVLRFISGGAEAARFTTAGVLQIGTTVAGANAGETLIAFNKAYNGVNAAGTGVIRVALVTTGNATLLGADGDIQWGRALVALGAGAAATLGNIGGAGPATAGQNTWMRVLDSAGAAFWVPAWK